jgi:hypothetical protein
MLDDFFDSYYIFVGDFDDDTYINELFIPIYNTIDYSIDNKDDGSFLTEDESPDALNPFFLYFVALGKLTYFIYFIVEEAGRLGLAFYICYLIIFEVHAVNCSHKEDSYFGPKYNS